LLIARDQTLDSVRQFLWAFLPYIYIMVIYWVIIRNVTVEKSLLLEARKLYVGLKHFMVPVIIFAPLYFTLIFIRRVQLRLLPTLYFLSLPVLAHTAIPQ
jgi:hypothetical protein